MRTALFGYRKRPVRDLLQRKQEEHAAAKQALEKEYEALQSEVDRLEREWAQKRKGGAAR